MKKAKGDSSDSGIVDVDMTDAPPIQQIQIPSMPANITAPVERVLNTEKDKKSLPTIVTPPSQG